MKPVIGVTPLYDEQKESIWMLPGYMDVLLACGALPLILPFSTDKQNLDKLLSLCDGFLFTGGQDIAPALYGEEKLSSCGAIYAERDRLDAALFRMAYAADRPILGICRGIQLFNTLLGGTLYQDIPSQLPTALTHRMHPPYDVPCHSVTLLSNTPLYTLFQADEIAVNSYHHQAIKQLAPPLRAMAVAPDGLVEAVYQPDKYFLQAVQWHPELSWQVDARQYQLMSSFVAACCHA